MKYLPILALILFSQSVNCTTFPEGWQLSIKQQYLKEDVEWYKGKLPNIVNADFNGDKILDKAWVLINKDKTKLGLFVSLSSSETNKVILKLVEVKLTNHINVGISLIESGEHKTACGKGYWKCEEGEAEVINITTSGLNFFTFESSNSVYYWSGNKFNHIWLSD